MNVAVSTRDVAAQARAALSGAPMSRHSESETEHATSGDRGRSVHVYAYRLSATVDGPVGDVLAVRRRLAAVEAAKIGPVRVA